MPYSRDHLVHEIDIKIVGILKIVAIEKLSVSLGLLDRSHVDLVAAHRADLRLPELARLGIEREAVAVAVAVREDLGTCAAPADERVVGRNAAVVPNAQRLARVVIERVSGKITYTVEGAT